MLFNNRYKINWIIRWASRYLARYHVFLPRLSAELILAEVLGINQVELYLRFEQLLGYEDLVIYKKILLRRLDHEPLAYILKRREFWGLTFIISPDVFIPRPETEHLVEESLNIIHNSSKYNRILDLCTGCGAVALALASECSKLELFANDISSKALRVARQNIIKFGFNKRIRLLQGNLWEAVSSIGDLFFDIIIANPPYIVESQWINLMREVKDYEPRIALISGFEGVEIIRDIIIGAPFYLNSLGWLLIELGEGQFKIAKEIAFRTKLYNYVYMIKDLSGKERVLACRRTNYG